MSFNLFKTDFFGDLVGKARRRELEGSVRVNLASLGKRLAVGVVAAGIAAAAKPDLLGTKPGLLSLGGIALTAMIPAGATPAGLITPARLGSPSVTEALVQSLVNAAQAPADKRQAAVTAAEEETQAKITAGVQAGLEKYGPVLVSLAAQELNKSGQYLPSELAPAAKPQAAPAGSAGAQTGTSTDSIAQTGGNQ